MLNSLATDVDSNAVNARALIEGHHTFLKNNTGDTDNAQIQHYVLNNQGVLANNRHFIAITQQEAQPNGDGTTEGQALLILGHCYAYLATKKKDYLDQAVIAFNAYLSKFYEGRPIPETPSRWICNWIVNAKEPVLANWPVDAEAPTHSGFKASLMTFVDGRVVIPHGAPHWGEYLDKATMAFDGALAWEAVNASVQALRPDGTIDWSTPGKEYPVDWIIAWTGQKIDWDGNVLSEGHPLAEHGTVQLKDVTVQGVHKFNYANRQPVEHGGVLIERNQTQHNRPLHVPLLGGTNQRGNAADAEEWFADACYMLWKLTGEDRYKKAMDSCIYTNMEYAKIDSTDMFFRQSKLATTPFTDGISYDFTFPSGVEVTYLRDEDGYITGYIPESANLSMEQQAIWFRINQASSIQTTFGGVGRSGKEVSARVELLIAMKKGEENEGNKWGFDLPTSTEMAPKEYNTTLGSIYKLTKDDGSEYITAKMNSVTDYGGCVVTSQYEQGVLGTRSVSTVKAFFPNDDAGFVVGNWTLPTEKAPITSVTYKSNGETDLRIQDDNGWRWYWVLANTNDQWVTRQLNPSNMVLSGYQPEHPDDPKPAAPVFTEVDQWTILLENGSDTNISWTYAYVNEVPPVFTEEDGYTLNYRITFGCDEEYDVRIGNCTVLNFRTDSLAYTPGVIPFSNIYEEGSDEIGAWHGLPYPGYQYPFIYVQDMANHSLELNNMVDFMYDAQQWYYTNIGELGPVASAYVWNRWDNYKYGEPDTFTMYHWGDGKAWSGYQPRAFQAACRAWEALVERGEEIPWKLKAYVENWVSWLYTYIKRYGNQLPTDFPSTSPVVPIPDDFTGHMTGLWLAGCCQAYEAGCRTEGIEAVIEACFAELNSNYILTGVANQPMNGSWSPAVRLGTDNGMFFGFWAGEILRGLGLYILHRQHKPSL